MYTDPLGLAPCLTVAINPISGYVPAGPPGKTFKGGSTLASATDFSSSKRAESKEIVICQPLIDALTFWCARIRNVTTSYGVNGFTEELFGGVARVRTRRVYIASFRTTRAPRGCGISAYRVVFPPVST
jgi:hypothetical protein